jgi:hypothetical protein
MPGGNSYTCDGRQRISENQLSSSKVREIA